MGEMASENPVAGEEDFNIEEASHNFWKLIGDLGQVSAPHNDWATACGNLGWTKEEYERADGVQPQLVIRPAPGRGAQQSTLYPKPWQVVGTDWMASQENSNIGGGLPVFDCGLGKTAMALLYIAKQAEKIEAGIAADANVADLDIRPTLVLCPYLLSTSGSRSGRPTSRRYSTLRNSTATWVKKSTIVIVGCLYYQRTPTKQWTK